nr:hypothetical protein 1 [Beihai paphia shell virus 1]
MKMSSRFANRAHQAQKLKLSKQDSTASKGVNYCKKCERRRLKKQKRERNLVTYVPPTCLINAWLFVCGCFYQPGVVDCFFSYVLTLHSLIFFLKIAFLSKMTIDSSILIWSWFGRLFRPKLEPQLGSLSADPFMKEVIQILCLFISLRDARTKNGMIAAIVQYLQAHVKHSLPLQIYRWVKRIDYIADWSSDAGISQIEKMLNETFEQDIREVDGEIVLQAQDGSVECTPWHIVVDDAFNNWKEFRHSTIAHKFTHLINVLVSCGMCSTADLTFKVGNVALFTPIVSKKQLAAGDIFDAFYEAVAGFMKGGWRVYSTGEVSAFFMEEDKITEFERYYNELRSQHGYAITGNLREYTDIDDNEYDARIKKAIEFGDNLLKTIPRNQVFERKYVSDRVDRLRDYDTEFTQLRTRGGLRICPFSVCFFGQSGCGKSSLTNLTVNAGLVYNDLSAEKDRIATWADNDKWASSIRSHINAIIFDDFANTKEEFMDFSPAYRLIQVINNIKYLAPMADVFLKGKVSLNPWFCVVSTNVEHLNAARYSNEPESVLRRLYHVKVEPKANCCEKGILNKKKIRALYGHTASPDAWYLTIRTYEAMNKKHVDLAAMIPISFEGKRMVRVSVKEYLRWLQIESKQHFTEEGQYLASQEGIPTKCEKCGMVYCDCSSSCNNNDSNNGSDTPEVDYASDSDSLCDDDGKSFVWSHDSFELESRITNLCFQNQSVLETQSGETQSEDCQYYAGYTGSFHRRAEELQKQYERAVTSTILTTNAVCLWWERFDFMPESWICHPRILSFGLIFWREDIRHSLIAGNSSFVVIMLFAIWIFPYFSLLWLGLSLFGMYWYTCATIQTYKCMVRNRILELKDVVHTYTQQWQFKYAIIGLGAIGVILGLLRSRYLTLNTQSLTPGSIEEINERNDRVNPWLVPECVPLPMSEPAKTTSSDNLAASMRTNLIGVISDINKTTLGFYITSNFMIVPTHFLREHGDRDVKVRCYKTTEGRVGSHFNDKISKAFRVEIPFTDFTICFVTGGGSMKDFRKFLPTGKVLRRSPAKLVTRDIMDTSLRAIPTLFQGSRQVAHTQQTFAGSYYDLPIETRPGMCMSPVISDMKGSVIMGFHLAGKGKLGGCGTLTLDQVNLAISELSSVNGVVLSASCGDLAPHMGDFPTETFGKPIFEGAEIHPKSAVNFLTEGACIDIYGKTSGKATPHSNVFPTIMSDAITEVFGVSQKWGPPKMKGKGRYPYQATLVHAAVPSLPVGSVLAKAVQSMKELTSGLKQQIPELFHVKPLTRVATVCGLSSVKFIDPMNFSSSPGFPLSGSKHSLLVDLDPKDYPDVGKPRTFVPEVWEEFERAVDILREGKRCYMIWKSCLKDEPTKLTKDKVRVFQSAPLVLQLIIRMYFLPLVRIIQMNPILYECAVGVNAEGLEWEELWEAAMSKGKDRVLAGDYSKYDVRMPAQVTIAAFDILIDIASKCVGYTADDNHLMKMVVNEVVYPVMAYNGDLIQLFGTNPSGQNLTVIINSLVNSLLLRSCFFTIYPNADFKENCSFLTYGDDVIGTVSSSCGGFTHITYAEWLAEHDMKFTMPDKESTPTHYMNEDDVDFLKRKCVFNADLGQKVGLLSEESIFKRLHTHLLSKELSLEAHSAQNIESSLHDWFYYGREVFEDRRDKLRRVAQKCGIECLCPALEISYDKRVNRWRHKYLGEELEEEEEEILLEPHCGDLDVSTVEFIYDPNWATNKAYLDYLDHCRGTEHDYRYWWEHILIKYGDLVCFSIIALLQRRGWKWKILPHGINGFDRRWLFFLTFRGELIPLLKWFIITVVRVYIPEWTVLLCRCIITPIVDKLYPILKGKKVQKTIARWIDQQLQAIRRYFLPYFGAIGDQFSQRKRKRSLMTLRQDFRTALLPILTRDDVKSVLTSIFEVAENNEKYGMQRIRDFAAQEIYEMAFRGEIDEGTSKMAVNALDALIRGLEQMP